MPMQDEKKPTADEGPVERSVGRLVSERTKDHLINLLGFGSLALLGLGIGGSLGHPLVGIAVAVSLPVVFVTALVAFRII